MKKLFYSFFMLITMSLAFVACDQKEPEPEVKSNCTPYSAQFMVDETGGAMYVFELITNDLDIENQSGNGEDLVLMMYAQPQEDGFPTAKKYEYIGFEELTDDLTDCLLGGLPISAEQVIGTFAYVIEDGQAVDILLCIDGTVEFKGNAQKGTLIANLELESVVSGDITTKEYIYDGPFDMEEMRENFPARVMSLNK